MTVVGKVGKTGILAQGAETLGIMALVVILVLTTLQVALRYVFRSPLQWAEEIVRLFSAWAIFLGSWVAVRKGLHVGVDYFVKMLPRRVQRGVDVVGKSITLLFCVIVAGASVTLISETWGTRSSAAGYPLPLFFASITVGLLGMLLETVCQLYTCICRTSCHCDGPSAGGEEK